MFKEILKNGKKKYWKSQVNLSVRKIGNHEVTATYFQFVMCRTSLAQTTQNFIWTWIYLRFVLHSPSMLYVDTKFVFVC